MDLFSQNGIRKDQLIAVDDNGRKITGRDLINVSDVLLRTVGKRKLVFIMCRNISGILLSYMACLQNGIVPLLLDGGIDKELLQRLISIYKPAYLIEPSKENAGDTDRADSSMDEINIMGCRIIPVFPGESPKLHEDLALLLSTSGSTGSPKLVRFSRKNILSNTQSIMQYLHITASERPITNLALNYSYGMSIINTHILSDAVILLTQHTIMEKEFWERVQNEGATSLAGVPYTYQIYHRLDLTHMDLPSLRYMTQAGGKLSKELHLEFALWAANTGRKFYIMYGQTEASPRMGYLPAEWAVEKCGAMGIPVPGGHFALVDENGQEITEPGEAGELVYTGNNTAMGYAKSPDDLIIGDEWHGVLRTGDMAVSDSTGFYYIVGRKKRFIKMFGNRIGLDEAEEMLSHEFSNAEFACIGRDDCLTIITSGSDEDQIRDEIKFLAGILKVPEYAIRTASVTQIPKNSNEKRDYGRMEKLYGERRED